MKKIIIFLIVCLCAFPAQADLRKEDFKLTASKEVVSVNHLIYLEARVKELEKELDILKKAKTFGNAYIDEKGQLKCRAEDGGKDWEWDGKTWFRR